MNMKLIEAAQAVIDACDVFAEIHVVRPARVQEREMAAVLAKLKVLGTVLEAKNPQFGIGTFPINKAGQRVDPAAEEPVGITHLVYIPEKDALGAFWTTQPLRAEDGSVAMIPLLPGIREITLSDLVEMGYSIKESIAFIKKLAEHLSFDAYAKAATGPSGLA